MLEVGVIDQVDEAPECSESIGILWKKGDLRKVQPHCFRRLAYPLGRRDGVRTINDLYSSFLKQ